MFRLNQKWLTDVLSSEDTRKWKIKVYEVGSVRVVSSSHCVLQCGASGCVALRVRVSWV